MEIHDTGYVSNPSQFCYVMQDVFEKTSELTLVINAELPSVYANAAFARMSEPEANRKFRMGAGAEIPPSSLTRRPGIL